MKPYKIIILQKKKKKVRPTSCIQMFYTLFEGWECCFNDNDPMNKSGLQISPLGCKLQAVESKIQYFQNEIFFVLRELDIRI